MRNIGYIISTSTSHNHISQAHNLGAPLLCLEENQKPKANIPIKDCKKSKHDSLLRQYLCGTVETPSTKTNLYVEKLLAFLCHWTFDG